MLAQDYQKRTLKKIPEELVPELTLPPPNRPRRMRMPDDFSTTLFNGAEKMETEYSPNELLQISTLQMNPKDLAFIGSKIKGFPDKLLDLQAAKIPEKAMYQVTEDFIMSPTGKDKMAIAAEKGIDKNLYVKGYMYGVTTVGTKDQRNKQLFGWINGNKELSPEHKNFLKNTLAVSGANKIEGRSPYETVKLLDMDVGGLTKKIRTGRRGRSSAGSGIRTSSAPVPTMNAKAANAERLMGELYDGRQLVSETMRRLDGGMSDAQRDATAAYRALLGRNTQYLR